MIVSWDKAGRKASKPGEQYKSELQFKGGKSIITSSMSLVFQNRFTQICFRVMQSFSRNVFCSPAAINHCRRKKVLVAKPEQHWKCYCCTVTCLQYPNKFLIICLTHTSVVLLNEKGGISGELWREKIDSFYQASKRAQDTTKICQ